MRRRPLPRQAWSDAPRHPHEQLPVELDDIQGLVRFGYKHHTEASFLLLRVSDRGAARRWLATVPVCTAETVEPPPETALQVALTGDGMRALGVADEIVERFAAEFVAGMAGDANRARRLGDVGANDPSRWQWGAGARVPHVAGAALCAAGQAGRVPGARSRRSAPPASSAIDLPDDERPRRHRAVRLHGRHLAAARSTGSGSARRSDAERD